MDSTNRNVRVRRPSDEQVMTLVNGDLASGYSSESGLKRDFYKMSK